MGTKNEIIDKAIDAIIDVEEVTDGKLQSEIISMLYSLRMCKDIEEE